MHRAARVDHHVDLARGEPAPEHGVERAGRGERAVGDGQHVVAAVGAQARAALVVDGEPHPRAPAQRAAGQLLDLDLPVHACEPRQLLGQHLRLPAALRGRRDVLQVAATAATRPRPGAGRGHPVGRRREHGDGVGPAEPAAGVLVDDRAHPLPRQRVPYEHDPPVVAGHAVPAVGDGVDLQLQYPVGPVQRRVHVRAHGFAAGVRTSAGPVS